MIFDNDGYNLYMSYMSGEHDPNSANMHTEWTPNYPYRLAHQINEHVVQEISLNDYFVGRAERSDIAEDFVHKVLSKKVEPPSLAYDGLIIWRRMFGGLDGMER